MIVYFEEFETPAFTSAFTSPALAVYQLLAEPTAIPELWSFFPAVPDSVSPRCEEPIWFDLSPHVIAENGLVPQ